MALYTRLLILTNTDEEATAINAKQNRVAMYYDEYAFPYGHLAHGVLFHDIEIRYDGVRNSLYEKEVAKRMRHYSPPEEN